MLESFRAFAEGLIDYAGIFPPAGLPLPEALRNYVRYREEREAWMLARFVCPAERLPEVQTPVRISALGRSGPAGTSSAESFDAGLRADIEEIARYRERMGPSGGVEAIEIRLPAGAEPRVVAGLRVFYEAPAAAAIPATIAAIEDAVASMGQRSASIERTGTPKDPPAPPGAIGFKLRSGGVTAEAFPSSEIVASAIAACRRARVPIKATAGLHHPVRAFRAEVGTKMHGFLNVFGAAFLAHAHRLDEERLRPILDEEDAGAFRFTDADFSWRDLRIETGMIRALRASVTSFGSCSFDEPRADLRELGILPRE